jgi:hypothetical protein
MQQQELTSSGNFLSPIGDPGKIDLPSCSGNGQRVIREDMLGMVWRCLTGKLPRN